MRYRAKLENSPVLYQVIWNWLTVNDPELVQAVDDHSHRTIQQALLQQALHSWTAQICSWVIRCQATDADAIALLRELGFQPLRPYQCWCPPGAGVDSNGTDQLPGGLRWAALNRRTAQLLWPIEQGGSHSHLRQITDRHWLDLLDRNLDRLDSIRAADRDRGIAP